MKAPRRARPSATTARVPPVAGPGAPAHPATAPEFRYDGLATRVLFAPGAIERLASEPEILAAQRIMLVCGPRTASSGTFARIRSLLGPRVRLAMEGVVEHSLAQMVEQTAGFARQEGVDLLLAVGGGSASDTAKAIAILLAEGGALLDHANVFTPPDRYVQRVLPNPKVPIVVVPTTLSAAEVTPGLGIHDGSGRKLLFWDVKLAPKLIVLDPQANREVPAALIASTGMNAIAHCVEGLYSRVRNPISDALAAGGLALLARALPAVMRDPDDVVARGDALIGANLSGQVIANARVGIHHALCHSLGVVAGLSHGVANAIMLPHAVAFNADAVPDRLRLVARAMGVDDSGLDDARAAQAAVDALRELQRGIGVPTRLRDVGVGRDTLAGVALGVLGDRGLYFNPRRAASREQLEALLEAAW